MSGGSYRSFIHATSQVLQMIETAKSCVDDMIDDLSSGFLVVDAAGKVLRANTVIGRLMGMDAEDCRGRSLFEVFDQENLPRVQAALGESVRTGEATRVELSVRPLGGYSASMGSPVFQWSINPLSERGADGSVLFSVLATDVSELRSSQSRVAEIFSSLSVGIISVTPQGTVQDLYTSYAEHLLGYSREEMLGVSVRSLIFTEHLNPFTKGQKKALDALASFESLDAMMFDALRDACPQEVRIQLPESRGGGFRYLGVTPQSVLSDGKIIKLLLLLQDKTAIVEAREAEKAEREVETASIRRILQIKRVSRDVLPIFVEELNNLVSRAQQLVHERKSKDLAATLHGIKGNSRVVRFEQLGVMSHELEEVILNPSGSGDEDARWIEIQDRITRISEEWGELSGLAGALLSAEESGKSGAEESASGGRDSKAKAIASLRGILDHLHAQRMVKPSPLLDLAVERVRLSLVGLSLIEARTLEPWLLTSATQTAETVEKPIQLQMDWGGVLLDESIRKTLTEVLLHLVNNAIDHGVEPRDVRISRGKPPEGRVFVQLTENDGLIRGVVRDDGPGIDVEKVKRTAMRLGLATTQDFIGKSKRELMRYVFESGLSTREQVNQVSGRGVGLSAVLESLKTINGSIEVMEGVPSGTRFEFTMEYSSPLRALRRAYPAGLVWERLKGVLDFMVKSQGCPFELVGFTVDPAVARGLVLCSPSHLIIGLSQKVFEFAKGGRVSIHCSLQNDGRLRLSVKQVKGPEIPFDSGAISPEFMMTPAVADRLLLIHKGVAEQSATELQLALEEWVQTRDIPDMGISFAPGIANERILELRGWFEAICAQMNVEIIPAKTARKKIEVQLQSDPRDVFSVSVDADREAFESRVLRAINLAMGIEY